VNRNVIGKIQSVALSARQCLPREALQTAAQRQHRSEIGKEKIALKFVWPREFRSQLAVNGRSIFSRLANISVPVPPGSSRIDGIRSRLDR